MTRSILTAVVLSIATLISAPACARGNPTSQPATRPAAARNDDGVGAGRRSTAQKMQDVFKKQEQTKKALRDRAMAEASAYADAGEGAEVPPPTPAELLAEAQLKLDGEVARHNARLGDLRRAEADARAAGDRKAAQRVRKEIESENNGYQRASAELRKQVRECQARVDAEARLSR
jgi:hypothetical protein